MAVAENHKSYSLSWRHCHFETESIEAIKPNDLN